MLADSTLAELTKSAPSREALVRLAWPALDVASKLRVIEVIPVSYTHLDVYKRQCPRRATLPSRPAEQKRKRNSS